MQRIGAKTDFKADLIEAKLHLAYAEIDRFTALNAGRAEEELGQAQMYLDRALEQAPNSETSQVLAIRDGVEELAVEQPADQDEPRYAALRSRLGKLIEAL